MTLGLKDLYYAVITMSNGVETYGTPKKMAEAMKANLAVKTAEAKLFADDALSESVKEFVSGDLTLGIKELAPEVVAERRRKRRSMGRRRRGTVRSSRL